MPNTDDSTATDEPEVNPTAARYRLAAAFRAERERQGESIAQLALLLGVSEGQASKIDSGSRGIQPDAAEMLAEHYSIPDERRTELLALAREARRRMWWQKELIPPAYRTLIGLENAADTICEYSAIVIPGLLQTAAYAEAVAASSAVDPGPIAAARAAKLRVRRQQVLRSASPPWLKVIIDEAVLVRGAGGPDVMLEQLRHLRNIAQGPKIEIQIIGFEYGSYPSHENFILLRMTSGIPNAVFTEDLNGSSISSTDADVTAGEQAWETLRAIALSPRASVDRLAKHIASLESGRPFTVGMVAVLAGQRERDSLPREEDHHDYD